MSLLSATLLSIQENLFILFDHEGLYFEGVEVIQFQHKLEQTEFKTSTCLKSPFEKYFHLAYECHIQHACPNKGKLHRCLLRTRRIRIQYNTHVFLPYVCHPIGKNIMRTLTYISNGNYVFNTYLKQLHVGRHVIQFGKKYRIKPSTYTYLATI